MLPLATTTELLERLAATSDDDAWRLLDGRMRPVLLSVVRKLGLSADEADEVVQQTLAEVFEGYAKGQYQRDRGRLRSWIISIARHATIDVFRRRGRVAGALQALDPEVPDEQGMTRIWEGEWEQHLACEAMLKLRSSSQVDARTIQAFELFALRGVPVMDVAATCGMSPSQVYVAKNRVAERLRAIVAELASAYEEAPP